MENTLHVVVVDDEPDVADSFAILVEQLGYEVETVYGGREALELLDEWHADVVFVDLGMPDINGFELADRLQQRDIRPPELIALTGYGRDEDRARSREHGFTRHLVKPPDIDEIVDILEEANPSRRARR